MVVIAAFSAYYDFCNNDLDLKILQKMVLILIAQLYMKCATHFRECDWDLVSGSKRYAIGQKLPFFNNCMSAETESK